MEELIKKELFKNINSFINELELTMDYLGQETISNLKKYIHSIKKNSDDFKTFVEYTNTQLSQFEPQISAVLFSNKKIKSDYYNFLNDICLFNNLLNFKVFENESKNTKKGLIKYLYSIYMSCIFLNQDLINDNDKDKDKELQSKLTAFINKIEKEAQEALKETDIKTSTKKSTRHQRRNAISDQGDLNNVMDSILGNQDILNIANDISKKMQSQQLNPMTMLSSLMTGNIENTPLQGLVEEIQQKVEAKIDSGEINKEKLEEQAKSIIGSIHNNPSALNSMPGMTDLIGNMVKDMEK